jgi:hypothetical protein
MRAGLIFAVLVFGAAGAGPALGQSAGVIQFVAGEVSLVRPGAPARSARKGVPVNVGDTLTTANGGLAQLKMGDGAIIVVAPDSRVTVAEFHYAGVEDGTEKVRYRLEQGGFRAVTGAIGRTHKKNYLIETPIAHMGVRGTDHETYYFPTTGPGNGEGAKPGAYNKVNTGKTFIRTGAGELEIEPNQVGFVASANDVPVILPAVPGFFNRSVAPRNARRPVPAQAADTRLAHAVDDQMVESGEVENRVRRAGPVAAAGPAPVVPPADPVPGAGTGRGPLVGYSVPNGAANFGRSGNGVTVELNGATLKESSSNNSMKWYSWPGGSTTVVGGESTNGLVHVIESSDMTSAAQLSALPASAVTATYAHTGGPAPTNYLGQAGKINSLQVDVNFATQQVTNYALDATLSATHWTAKGNGSFVQFTGPGGIDLTGNCAGCTSGAGAATAQGTAHGAFVGPKAEEMITTFGLTAAGQSLTGAAMLKR